MVLFIHTNFGYQSDHYKLTKKIDLRQPCSLNQIGNVLADFVLGLLVLPNEGDVGELSTTYYLFFLFLLI